MYYYLLTAFYFIISSPLDAAVYKIPAIFHPNKLHAQFAKHLFHRKLAELYADDNLDQGPGLRCMAVGLIKAEQISSFDLAATISVGTPIDLHADYFTQQQKDQSQRSFNVILDLQTSSDLVLISEDGDLDYIPNTYLLNTYSTQLHLLLLFNMKAKSLFWIKVMFLAMLALNLGENEPHLDDPRQEQCVVDDEQPLQSYSFGLPQQEFFDSMTTNEQGTSDLALQCLKDTI
uniref:Uncharacterized protein n=1 Tax=Ditylenchus dipsaci TaxID=166011 RepID=A0A915DU75_9BILA